MKARTKYQKQVEAANDALPLYQGKAVKWAYEHCATHYGYRLSGGKTTCMECGHIWKTNAKKERCPECGRKLEIKDTKERVCNQSVYFCVLSTLRGLQLQRIFKLSVRQRKYQPVDYFAEEVARYWLNEKGQVAVTAKLRMMSWYYGALNMYSDIELRKDNPEYRWLADCFIYPRRRFIPTLKRNGLKNIPDNVNPLALMEGLLKDPRVETMVKADRINDASYFLSSNFRDLSHYWEAYKITLRNNYTISDINLWCDLVRLLEDCGKDTHNAYYVCPRDLKSEHDHYLRAKQDANQKQKREEQHRKAIMAEAVFEKAKGKFFGLQFTDGIIVISVLNSVEAYYAEGDAMHHCVGEMEYYRKPDSLVLSARINGERVETIEVSLSTFKIIQSRGLCNKNTEFHERIIGLVESNMDLIRKAI